MNDTGLRITSSRVDSAAAAFRGNLMGSEPAKNPKNAEWVEEALRRGDFGRVSGVVPLDFEACVAILHWLRATSIPGRCWSNGTLRRTRVDGRVGGLRHAGSRGRREVGELGVAL